MARRLFAAASLAATLLAGTAHAQANLIASTPVDGLATFEDLSTGQIWLDLPDLFNMTYSAQVAAAEAAGFTVADFAQVNALGTGSADLSAGQWSGVEAIIGGSSGRALMWGNYDSGDGGNSWYYAYQGDTGWSYYNPNDADAYSDLGLWAYEAAPQQVPEPASIAMFGAGLAGICLIRRRRSV